MKRREYLFLAALGGVGVFAQVLRSTDVLKSDDQIAVEQEAREFDPSRLEAIPPVKTAPVLALHGTVGGARFEIVMRGFAYYFSKETWGSPSGARNLLGFQRPGGYRVALSIHDFHGTKSLRWWAYNGGRGGGGYGFGYTNRLVPGRSVWSSKGFVGAQCQNQFRSEWSGREEFGKLCKTDGRFIPQEIRWNEDGDTRVFKVKKWEFRNEPSEAWFTNRLHEYFPRVERSQDEPLHRETPEP